MDSNAQTIAHRSHLQGQDAEDASRRASAPETSAQLEHEQALQQDAQEPRNGSPEPEHMDVDPSDFPQYGRPPALKKKDEAVHGSLKKAEEGGEDAEKGADKGGSESAQSLEGGSSKQPSKDMELSAGPVPACKSALNARKRRATSEGEEGEGDEEDEEDEEDEKDDKGAKDEKVGKERAKRPSEEEASAHSKRAKLSGEGSVGSEASSRCGNRTLTVTECELLITSMRAQPAITDDTPDASTLFRTFMPERTTFPKKSLYLTEDMIAEGDVWFSEMTRVSGRPLRVGQEIFMRSDLLQAGAFGRRKIADRFETLFWNEMIRIADTAFTLADEPCSNCYAAGSDTCSTDTRTRGEACTRCCVLKHRCSFVGRRGQERSRALGRLEGAAAKTMPWDWVAAQSRAIERP